MRTIKHSAIIFSFIALSFACNKKANTETGDKTTTENITNVAKDVTKKGLSVGSGIPDTLGVNQDNKILTKADFAGKKLVIYFYPKDESVGCTTQACNFRDNYDDLIAKGYAIIGVSADSVEEHKAFIAKEKLPFDLIADTDKSLIKAFDALETTQINGESIDKIKRITYIIDENGIITSVIQPENVDVSKHSFQILELSK